MRFKKKMLIFKKLEALKEKTPEQLETERVMQELVKEMELKNEQLRLVQKSIEEHAHKEEQEMLSLVNKPKAGRPRKNVETSPKEEDKDEQT